MTKPNAVKIVIALLCVGTACAQRWSRQVQSTGFTGGLSDWVPVQFQGQQASSDRQTGARVLNFAPPAQQQSSPPQQQLHQQQQHQHQQPQQTPYIPQHIFQHQQPQQINFGGAGEPFQLVSSGQQRFEVQQSQPLQYQHQLSSPAGPPKNLVSSTPHLFQQPQQPPPPAQQLPQFHYTQLQPSPSAFPPQQQLQHQQQLAPQFVQERPQHLPQQVHALQLSPAEINQQYQFPQFIEQEPQVQTQQQQIQHVVQQQYEVPQAPTFLQHNAGNTRPQTEPLIQRNPQLYGQEPEPIIRHNQQLPIRGQDPEEEVQLLYVPLETLHQQNPHRTPQQPKPQPSIQASKYNVQPVNPLQINNFYTSTPSSIYSPTTPAPYATSPANVFGSTSRFPQSPTTTPKPKNKSHQPPLAMFMLNDAGQAGISVNDVLKALKNAKNIDVLDSATKKSPKVFVGPSGLRTPSGYSKFELPYLSSIEQNRAERQVNKLPFFVAPLSYKAPNGFAKIPLPAPHVGSVVVNTPPEVIEYQSVNLQVPQHQPQRQPQHQPQQLPQQQPQRTQIYPKKVQSQVTLSVPNQEHTTSIYRSQPKYNFGFKLGSDVFTTSPKSAFYNPSSTIGSNDDQLYQFVSTTPAYKESEQFTQKPTTQANFPSFVSSTQSPRQQQETFSKTRGDDFYNGFVSSTQKPAQQYEQFNRRPQPATQRSPAYQTFAASTTPGPIKSEQSNHFEQPSYNSVRPVSSTKAPLATYSSQQHEEEYSNFGNFGQFNSQTRSPPKVHTTTVAPKANAYEDSFSGFLNTKTQPTASVQSEEYFNIQKSPQLESFAIQNETQPQGTLTASQYDQFEPSKDYFNSQQVTSSASSASAPKPTESEHYSFEPILGTKPSTSRPEVAYTPKPVEYSTRAQEIIKMKNYFREQTAFKSRPQVQPAVSPSSTPYYDYTTSSSEATSTESKYTTPEPRKITYYTPSPHFEEDNDKPVHHFKYVDSVVGNNFQRESSRTTESYKNNDYQFPIVSSNSEKSIYSNHRETYEEASPVEYKPRPKAVTADYETTSQTESPYDIYTKSHDTKNQYRPNVEINNTPDEDYETNIYNLPSELPPISAHLPGLVNSLYVEQTESQPITTTTSAPTTRRIVNRGRRPQSQSTRATVTRAPVTRPPRTTTVTSSSAAETDSDEYTTRRTTIRGRRPIHYANRTTTSRTPTARNPNRVRYNPTSEERQRVRTKQAGKSKDEDLEYQRDVLNQNYPVITKPTSTELPPTTESDRPSKYTTAVSYAHETERYSSHYRADPDQETTFDIPANHSPSPRDYLLTTPRSLFNELPSHFSGLEDHMQIPQEHQALHGAFYNSESDVSAAEAINGRGTVDTHPVFLPETSPTTEPTTTTEEVTISENVIEPHRSRRPNFIKRPSGGRSVITSTTTPFPTVTQTNDRGSRERFTIRPKTKQDAATVGYTPKPRLGRLRTRPTTTVAPTTREPEVQTYVDDNYQQISRFNKDFYQDAPARVKNTPQKYQQPKSVRVSNSNEQKRFKYDRFALDAQESQWSTKLSQNSFIPVDPESPKSAKSLKNSYDFSSEAEPEIVTAGSLLDDDTNEDSYLLKVSSSFAGNAASPVKSNDVNTTASSNSEASFVDLLEEAMSDIGNEIVNKQPDMQDRNEVIAVTTNAPVKGETSTDIPSTQQPHTNGAKRRGVWKRVRVRPVDGFETAESQNYGHRVLNALLPGEANKEQPQKVLSLIPSPIADEVDESELPRSDEFTTVFPTFKLPAADIETSNAKNLTNEAAVITTEQPESTTLAVERLEEKEEESEPSAVSTTTVTSTRRYDLSEEDLLMEESDQDHTEFPFSFDGVNDEVDTKTDLPVTERSYYDDYDADYKTEATHVLSEPDSSPASNMMSEVKQKLTELFSFNDDYDYENTIRPKQQPAVYTTIERTKSAEKIDDELMSTSTEALSVEPEISLTERPITTTTTPASTSKSFHKKLMESVVYATSTSTEISHETEICYRGRCIKSDKRT